MTREVGTKHPWFGAPPARVPLPAAEVPALVGKRVVLSTPNGFVYDMRAVSDRYVDSALGEAIAVTSEEAYFRWMFLDDRPRSEPWAVRLVWVE